MAKRSLKSPDWEAIRISLATRAGYKCEGCGLPFHPHPVYGFSVSHRLPRSAGIKAEWVHQSANLALFCGQGSEVGTCHGACKDDFATSLAKGWVISRFDHRLPSEIPIFLHDGWYLLDDFGGKTRVVDDELPAS